MKMPRRHHKRLPTDVGCRTTRHAAQDRHRDALITEAEMRRIWPSR
jgi:hypothetical protein